MNVTNRPNSLTPDGALHLAEATMNQDSLGDDGKANTMVRILTQSNKGEGHDPVGTPVAVGVSLKIPVESAKEETGHARRTRWWTLPLSGNKC